MRIFVFIFCMALSLALTAAENLAIGRDSVVFSSSLADSTAKKNVELKAETPRNSPFNFYLWYDSTKIRIHSKKGPLTEKDSLTANERGILSRRWGVREGSRTRYLAISDLKQLGLKEIGPKEISDWITGGRVVRSTDHLRQFASELKNSGVIARDLPMGFMATEVRNVRDFRLVTVTIFDSPTFTRYQYLVSPGNEVMLWKREDLFKVRFPEYAPISASPGTFILKNPADTAIDRISTRYMELTGKYENLLFQ